MSLPRRRRSRPRGAAGLTPVPDSPDIPDSSEADTEQWLSQIRPDDYDARTWRDASGAATPAGVTPIAIQQAGQDTEPLARLRTQPRYRPPAPAPPAPRPPAIRPLAPELPPHEGLPAAQVTAMLDAIRYPGADGTPEDYAAVMRRWSHLTGTATGLESPGAWPRHAIAGATHRTAGAR